MTSASARSRRAAGRPLKSPLAVAGGSWQPDPAAGREAPVTRGSLLPDRAVTLAEFEEYLRTTTNRDGRPYEEATINAYLSPVKNLDAWMTATGIDGDFTVASTVLLNRYFREYYLKHGQGGTHTLQRNLIQLFNFLSGERNHPTPYTDKLNRYAEVKGRPKTLGTEFIEDLLKVTGGGRARDFAAARDHAMIRILRSEGIRRAELLGMVMHSLPADVIKNPLIRLVPLKGARVSGEGRLISLSPASARALAVYLSCPAFSGQGICG
jgi:site-specific recombinase XerD